MISFPFHKFSQSVESDKGEDDNYLKWGNIGYA